MNNVDFSTLTGQCLSPPITRGQCLLPPITRGLLVEDQNILNINCFQRNMHVIILSLKL